MQVVVFKLEIELDKLEEVNGRVGAAELRAELHRSVVDMNPPLK